MDPPRTPQYSILDHRYAVRAVLTLALTLRRDPATARSDAFARALAATPAPELRPAPHKPHAPYTPRSTEYAARSTKDSNLDPRPAPPSAPRPAEDGVRNTEYAAPPTPHEVRSTEHAARSTEHAAPDTRFSIIDTQYAGLLFLLNLFTARGLYPDFSAPFAPRLALDPWELLALIGAALWGEAWPADPLDGLLAELAGRAPGDAPAADFSPPDGESLDAWFAALWASLRADLIAALDLEEEQLPALLRRRARIEHGPVRLDITFALDDLDLGIRRAGLDRDPGWIPAARRALWFHFE